MHSFSVIAAVAALVGLSSAAAIRTTPGYVSVIVSTTSGGAGPYTNATVGVPIPGEYTGPELAAVSTLYVDPSAAAGTVCIVRTDKTNRVFKADEPARLSTNTVVADAISCAVDVQE